MEQHPVTEQEMVDDHRGRAALAVLGGEPVADVAARIGVEEALVVRWTRQFVEGGGAALRSESATDPAVRDRFLALVSHELRTPLTVMAGWIDTMRAHPDEARDPDLVDAGLAAMAGHTERLARLADDLLDTAAVSLGRLTLEPADVDLAAVCAAVAASFEGGRVHVDATGIVGIRADPIRLGQMLTNLVSDGLGRTGERLELTVDDDGTWATVGLHVPCIPPPFEEMHALFEPFDRGTGNAHTGLGLYVTRALAVAHGGQCGVDAGDASVTFWLRLPVTGPAAGRSTDDSG